MAKYCAASVLIISYYRRSSGPRVGVGLGVIATLNILSSKKQRIKKQQQINQCKTKSFTGSKLRVNWKSDIHLYTKLHCFAM